MRFKGMLNIFSRKERNHTASEENSDSVIVKPGLKIETREFKIVQGHIVENIDEEEFKLISNRINGVFRNYQSIKDSLTKEEDFEANDLFIYRRRKDFIEDIFDDQRRNSILCFLEVNSEILPDITYEIDYFDIKFQLDLLFKSLHEIFSEIPVRLVADFKDSVLHISFFHIHRTRVGTFNLSEVKDSQDFLNLFKLSENTSFFVISYQTAKDRFIHENKILEISKNIENKIVSLLRSNQITDSITLDTAIDISEIKNSILNNWILQTQKACDIEFSYIEPENEIEDRKIKITLIRKFKLGVMGNDS